jgi:hypothetical protein
MDIFWSLWNRTVRSFCNIYCTSVHTRNFFSCFCIKYIPFLNSLLKYSSSHYSLFCHWLILCSGYLPLDARKNRQFISQAAFWWFFQGHRQLLEGFSLIEIAAEIIHFSKSQNDGNIFHKRRKGKYTDLIPIDLLKVFILWDFPFKVRAFGRRIKMK